MLAPRPVDRHGLRPGPRSRRRARTCAGAFLFTLLLTAATASAQGIFGTVFEDANYGGGAGRDLATSAGVPRPNARVELYDGTGSFVSFATTDAAGAYTFSGLPAPGNYTVRVVNASVSSSRPGWVGTLVPVQTYRTDASSGVALGVDDRVGGEAPALVDAGNGTTTLAALATATTAAQSISLVALSLDVTGVDFGFSFSVVVNVNDAGQGSLRQFLTNANALANTGLAQAGRTPGIEHAVFELPGSGPHTIAPATWLPSITNPVVLDGTTQPGFSGTPIIELDGSATTYGTGLNAGVVILAGNSTVRGLVINRFAVDGIRLETGSNNVIEGNYIGTDISGLLDRGNAFDGVFIVGGSAGNRIGGLLPGQGNVISGNDDEGLDLRPGSATLVQGNLIGIAADGTTALGNVSDGVQITGGTGNAVTANRIAANGGLGIDLLDNGVTLNDLLDADTGPNDLLNFPAITSARQYGGTLTANFNLDVPAGSYRIEFFKNPSGADASGYGEGELFASSMNLTHPGGGALSFGHSFTGGPGDVITATTTACTDGPACAAFGNTSEFSNAMTTVTTAVRLMSFTAVARDRAVDLSWHTGSELNNLGFHLYRGPSTDGPWTRLNSSLIPGQGFSATGAAYTWGDSGLQNGVRYFYRLEDVDSTSGSTFHGPASAVPGAPPATPPAQDGGPVPGDAPAGGGSGAPNSCPAWARAQLGSSAAYTCETHGDPFATSFRVLSQAAHGVVVELQTGGFLTARDASGRVRALVPGFDSLSDPLAPALPLKRALLEGVVGMRARIHSIEARDLRSFPGLLPAAVGFPRAVVSADGTVRPGRRSATLRPVGRGYLPREPARLSGEGFLGEEKTLTVELVPLRFDVLRGQLLLARRLVVRIAFAGGDRLEKGRGRFGRRPRKPRSDTQAYAFLGTSAKGLHAATFDSLFPGRRRPVDVAALRLTREPDPGSGPGTSRVLVPFHVEPRMGSFGPGSRLFFHSDVLAPSTGFSPEVVYALERGTGGARMGVGRVSVQGSAVASSRALGTWETNRLFVPDILDIEDLWQWESMLGGASMATAFALDGLDAASPETARIVVHLQGGSDAESLVDHHVKVSVNGVVIGEENFDGAVPYRVESEVPVSLLRSDANELLVLNVGDMGVSSRVFLDRFEVLYPQVGAVRAGSFDGIFSKAGMAEVTGLVSTAAIVDLTTGTWLTGYEAGGSVRFRAEAHRYLAVSEEALLSPRVFFPEATTRLKSPLVQADYVLIAPRSFLAAAQPLLDRRASQGLTTFAASLEEIASSFGGGQPSAEAIRDFLSSAWHGWKRPSPRYVVLLGDANHDPRHFVASSQPSPMPFLLHKTSYIWTVSDPALAAVNGDDLLPDLAIGRLPATTVEQAQALVGKILDWEDQGNTLEGRVTLVADNPDLAGDFEANVQDIDSSFLAGRDATSILLGRLENGEVARTQILDAFNEGLSLISYVGHGGGAVWAGENILNSWDAALLQAQPRQPLMLTMNCLNGYFITPYYESLAEAFLKAEGRGTVAAFSPSGLSLDGPAHVYHRAVMRELTSGQHLRLGDALLAAQREYAATGAMPELLSLYHLFGDPATRVR